jgi:hypothetical protein
MEKLEARAPKNVESSMVRFFGQGRDRHGLWRSATLVVLAREDHPDRLSGLSISPSCPPSFVYGFAGM